MWRSRYRPYVAVDDVYTDVLEEHFTGSFRYSRRCRYVEFDKKIISANNECSFVLSKIESQGGGPASDLVFCPELQGSDL